MLSFLKRYAFSFLLVAISMATYRAWLSPSIFSYSDYWFLHDESLADFASMGTWNAMINLGGDNLGLLYRAPLHLLFGLFDQYVVANFVLVFFPIIFLFPLAAFWFSKQLLKHDFAAFVAAVVLCFNSYILSINTQGHLLLTIGIAFGLWSLGWLLHPVRSYSHILFSALALAACAVYDFRFFYIFFVFLHLPILAIRVIRQKQWRHGLLFLVTIGFLLAFFLLPLAVFHSSDQLQSILGRELFGSSFFTLEHALTLHHPFWNGGAIQWFFTEGPEFLFFLIPALALLGYFVARKDPRATFFLLLAVVGIFLSKQESAPFPHAYSWLFTHIPGFQAFREATKFYILTAIGYSALFGFLAMHGTRRFLRFGAVGLMLLTMLVNTLPYLTGSIGTMMAPRTIQEDYMVWKEFLLRQDEFFRTLWIPRASRWLYLSNQKPALSAIDLAYSDWSSYATKSQQGASVSPEFFLMELLTHPRANEILDLASVKYVVLPIQDKVNDDDFFPYYGGRDNPNIRRWYEDQFDAVEWLKKIEIGTQELIVYENRDYRPYAVLETNPPVAIKSRAISSTEHRIELKRIKEKTRVTISERYDPFWRFSLSETLWLPAEAQQKTDAYTMTFEIDPQWIKQHVNPQVYRLHADGSISLEARLRYCPEAYYRFGFLLSTLTLIATIGYLAWTYAFSFFRKK